MQKASHLPRRNGRYRFVRNGDATRRAARKSAAGEIEIPSCATHTERKREAASASGKKGPRVAEVRINKTKGSRGVFRGSSRLACAAHAESAHKAKRERAARAFLIVPRRTCALCFRAVCTVRVDLRSDLITFILREPSSPLSPIFVTRPLDRCRFGGASEAAEISDVYEDLDER